MQAHTSCHNRNLAHLMFLQELPFVLFWQMQYCHIQVSLEYCDKKDHHLILSLSPLFSYIPLPGLPSWLHQIIANNFSLRGISGLPLQYPQPPCHPSAHAASLCCPLTQSPKSTDALFSTCFMQKSVSLCFHSKAFLNPMAVTKIAKYPT